MYCGRPAVLMTPATFVKRPVEWLRAISRHRATVSFAPNFAYDLCVRRVKERDLEGLDLSCWRVAGCGAEPIHAATLAAFADKFRAGRLSGDQLPAELRPGRARARRDACAARARDPRRAPIGRRSGELRSPLPGHRIRIVADDGRELADGATGEIALAGPSVMQGYYRRRRDDRRHHSRRLAVHGRPRISGRTASSSCADAPRTPWSSTAASIIRRIWNGPSTISRASAAAAWSRLARRAPGCADRSGDRRRAERGRRRRPADGRRFATASATRPACTSTRSCWCQAARSRGRRAARCSGSR